MNRVDVNTGCIQIFDGFEKTENQIAKLLLKNFDLMRLIYYNDADPLSKPMDEELAERIVTEYKAKPIINDSGESIYERNPHCRIRFEPFTGEIENQDNAQIRIYALQINPSNKYLGELFIQMDIIVNLNINKIKGGKRRDKIASELIRSLNGQEISMVSDLRLADKAAGLRQFKDEFWGWSMLFVTGVSVP